MLFTPIPYSRRFGIALVLAAVFFVLPSMAESLADEKADQVEAAAERSADESAKPEVMIRQLKSKTPLDPFQREIRVGESRVLASADELEQVFGKKAGKELAQQVDFTKEKVAAFGFTTAGPPFGKPKGEVERDGKKQWIEFSVEEPAGNGPRGRALELGRAFYAVPKDIDVEFPGSKKDR